MALEAGFVFRSVSFTHYEWAERRGPSGWDTAAVIDLDTAHVAFIHLKARPHAPALDSERRAIRQP